MEKVCSEMGLSMNATFTIFAIKVSRERRITFEVNADPFYNDENIRYLENIMKDIKTGKVQFEEHDIID